MCLLPHESEPGHWSDVLEKPDALKFAFEKIKGRACSAAFYFIRIGLLG
jgi:hypothetical protein